MERIPALLRDLLATSDPSAAAFLPKLQLLLAALVQSHQALTAQQEQQAKQQGEGGEVAGLQQREKAAAALQARAAAALQAMNALVAAAPEAFAAGGADTARRSRAGGEEAGSAAAAVQPGVGDSGGAAAALQQQAPRALPELLRLLRPSTVLAGAVRELNALHAAGRAREGTEQAAWGQMEALVLQERQAVQAVRESARDALGGFVGGRPLRCCCACCGFKLQHFTALQLEWVRERQGASVLVAPAALVPFWLHGSPHSSPARPPAPLPPLLQAWQSAPTGCGAPPPGRPLTKRSRGWGGCGGTCIAA